MIRAFKKHTKNKSHPNWKGRNKIVSLQDEKTLYIENPKDYTPKHLELINKLVRTKK